MNRLVRALLLLTLMCGASSARADLGVPLTIKLNNLTGPAVAGQSVTFGVELKSSQALTVRNLSLTGGTATGGGPRPLGLPDSVVLVPNVATQLTLTALPTLTSPVYRFQGLVGNRIAVQYLDLSRGHFDQMFRNNQAVDIGDVVIAPVDPNSDDDPGPGGDPMSVRSPFLEPLRDRRASAMGAHSTEGRYIRVFGKVRYHRQDGEWIPADHLTVRIIDEETGFDDLLAEVRTNNAGEYDLNVWSDEEEPDLYIEFATINGAVEVQDGTWNSTYTWATSVREDYTGSTLNFGTLSSSDEYIRPALHMLNNATRAWRWFKNTMGVNPPRQQFEWPSGDWPHYDPYGGDIHIPQYVAGLENFKSRWNSATHVHEFGHALMNEVWDYTPPFDYDNGICNNPNGDPGHCGFCQEDGGTALSEGWGNYLAGEVIDQYESKYGIAEDSQYTRNQESLGNCLDNQDPNMSCPCDPYRTENFFSRLMHDLTDNTPDEVDGFAAANGQDLANFGAFEVVKLLRDWHPTSPASYINLFVLNHPTMNKEAFWATLANNKYVLDDNIAPAVPSGLTSTDHTAVANADPTIRVVWNTPTDNFSGVASIDLQRATSSGGPWTTVVSAQDTSFYVSLEMSPGNYYFRIRARDRAGNLSAYSSAAGPFAIRDPLPADFGTTVLTGWDSFVVPRDANDATTGNVHVSAALDGGVNNTYLSLAGINHGELASTANNRTRIVLDGAPIDSVIWGFISAGGTFQSRNNGPRTVRGGRHTLELWYDAADGSPEPIETDNRKGVQYTWNGEKVSVGARVRRSAPPHATGGHNSFTVPIGQTKFKNVDGLYYTHTRTFPFTVYPWAAMWVAPVSKTVNYDCYIGTHSTGTQDGGYTTGLVTSARAAGLLDAVITNTSSAWDVGVLNAAGSTSDYYASCVVAPTTPLVNGDSISIALTDTTMMALRALTTPSGTAKTLVEVQITAGTGPLYVMWLANDYTYGTISTYDGKVGTDGRGKAVLTVPSTAAAEHGLVFYRNPGDGWGAITFSVKVRTKPGDPVPTTIAGWYSPLVPRPLGDATTSNVPAPVSLTGEITNTYFNTTLTNVSDATTGFINLGLYLDRTFLGNLLYASLAGGAVGKRINDLPTPQPAGRHVAHVKVDYPGVLNELSETNNEYGEQWVWAPVPGLLNTPVWRKGTNGSAVEGWTSCITTSEELAFNVDGMRSPALSAANGAWAGFAITPGAGSDMDLNLFETASSPKIGFDDPLAYSSWSGDATEFVLVNFGATNYRPFDMGALRASNDTTSYLANMVGSVQRASGINGPFTLGGGRVLELHTFDLGAGHHVLDVLNKTGTVDWGVGVYANPRPYQNRSDGADVGAADVNGVGGHEHVEFDLPSPQKVCVAVYKTGANEQGKSGTYNLVIDAAFLDADDAPPSLTRLAGARPSPFVGQTTLSFELAREDDVALEVYDLRGARVRTLARGAYPAGRHAVAWDGRDDNGRRTAAGVYLVRMASAGYTGQLKVVRVE